MSSILPDARERAIGAIAVTERLIGGFRVAFVSKMTGFSWAEKRGTLEPGSVAVVVLLNYFMNHAGDICCY